MSKWKGDIDLRSYNQPGKKIPRPTKGKEGQNWYLAKFFFKKLTTEEDHN